MNGEAQFFEFLEDPKRVGPGLIGEDQAACPFPIKRDFHPGFCGTDGIHRILRKAVDSLFPEQRCGSGNQVQVRNTTGDSAAGMDLMGLRKPGRNGVTPGVDLPKKGVPERMSGDMFQMAEWREPCFCRAVGMVGHDIQFQGSTGQGPGFVKNDIADRSDALEHITPFD